MCVKHQNDRDKKNYKILKTRNSVFVRISTNASSKLGKDFQDRGIRNLPLSHTQTYCIWTNTIGIKVNLPISSNTVARCPLYSACGVPWINYRLWTPFLAIACQLPSNQEREMIKGTSTGASIVSISTVLYRFIP